MNRAKTENIGFFPFFVIGFIIIAGFFALMNMRDANIDAAAAASVELLQKDCRSLLNKCISSCLESELEVCRMECTYDYDECIYYNRN
jgi:hypothetical protein